MPYNGESIQPAGCSFSLAISTERFCLVGSIASNSVTDALSIALHWFVPGSFPQIVGSQDQEASKLHE